MKLKISLLSVGRAGLLTRVGRPVRQADEDVGRGPGGPPDMGSSSSFGGPQSRARKQAAKLAASGLILLLCACNPAPKYAKPPAAAPAAFKEGAGWKVAEPGDDK